MEGTPRAVRALLLPGLQKCWLPAAASDGHTGGPNTRLYYRTDRIGPRRFG